MSAFTTVTVKISKTKTKRLTSGKNRGEIGGGGGGFEDGFEADDDVA